MERTSNRNVTSTFQRSDERPVGSFTMCQHTVETGNQLADKKAKDATMYMNTDLVIYLSKTEVRDVIKQNKGEVAKAVGGRAKGKRGNERLSRMRFGHTQPNSTRLKFEV